MGQRVRVWQMRENIVGNITVQIKKKSIHVVYQLIISRITAYKQGFRKDRFMFLLHETIVRIKFLYMLQY